MEDKYVFTQDRTALNISHLQYSDIGNYSLAATNEAGITEALIILDLEGIYGFVNFDDIYCVLYYYDYFIALLMCS